MANNCKIFTPHDYVLELLDAAHYTKNLYGKKVLENSCGEGFILIEIVKRYIKDCLKNNMSYNSIKLGLEKDIRGVEIEKEHRNNCIKNLNKVAADYNIPKVKWDITLGNYLKSKIKNKYDFIIGNPPYIVYRDIETKERDFIRSNFNVCEKGKFDYYYAFLEHGITMLNETGKLAYIIPTSIYKNVFADKLRTYMKELITDLYDYTSVNKFPGITTSSTILVLDKEKLSKHLIYHDVVNKNKTCISKADLAEKWCFNDVNSKKKRYKFGEYYNVSNTIATLYNKAFLLENAVTSENYVYNNNLPIENEVVKPAISLKRGRRIPNLKIIYPYTYENGKLIKFTEEEFKSKFPFATDYLNQYSTRLKERNADKNAKWFEYGRSQAINHMNQCKIVMPSIISSKVISVIVEEDVIPCAGFFITCKKDRNLKDGKRILESQKFESYLNKIGIFTTGKSRRITVKDISEYQFDEWEE